MQTEPLYTLLSSLENSFHHLLGDVCCLGGWCLADCPVSTPQHYLHRVGKFLG